MDTQKLNILSEALSLWIETFSTNTDINLVFTDLKVSDDDRVAMLTLGPEASSPEVTYFIEPVNQNNIEAFVTIKSGGEIIKGEIHSPSPLGIVPIFVSYN